MRGRRGQWTECHGVWWLDDPPPMRDCPDCEGTGTVEDFRVDGGTTDCRRCEGKGEIVDERDLRDEDDDE